MATIIGTQNPDILDGTADSDIITGLAGNDGLVGYDGADVIDGGDGDDYLYASDLASGYDRGTDRDTLLGGAGADFISAGYGDTVDGGSDGVFRGDTLRMSFVGAPSGVIADFRQASLTIGGATITGFEAVAGVLGSDFDDDITMPMINGGLGADAVLSGRGGNDRLVAGTFTGQVYGGDGNDTIDGREALQLLVADGGAGDDLIYASRFSSITFAGGDGNDAFYFGPYFTGNEFIHGDAGTRDQIGLQGDYAAGVTLGEDIDGVEQVVLLAGNDTRFGDTGGASYSYVITTGETAIIAGQQMVFQANLLRAGENFTLVATGETDGSVFTYGGQGNDLLTGSQGSDAFFFGTGRFGSGDVVNGQGGAFDSFGLQGTYSGANQVILGAGQLIGIEQLVFLSNTDSRFGGAGSGTPYSYTFKTHDSTVAAGARLVVQANTLTSDERLFFIGVDETDGAFSIFSGNGGDTIYGGAGDDIISGRGGRDTLYGGGGNDSYLYTNLSDSTPDLYDMLADFRLGDSIDLSRLDAVPGGADDAFNFIGAAAFSNTPGELRAYNHAGNNWFVEADVNGDAVADFVIRLLVTDNHLITATDFVF